MENKTRKKGIHLSVLYGLSTGPAIHQLKKKDIDFLVLAARQRN